MPPESLADIVETHPARRPVPVIFDTDMSSDVDDVGALAMLHALEDQGEAELLGVIVTTGDELTAPAADAVNTFYGRPDVPIGVLPVYDDPEAAPPANPSPYTRALAEEFPNDLRTGRNAPDAVRVYRELLASQPDNSVTLVVVGFATNVRRLLESGPDGISPLSGRELLARKVRVYAAGGNGSGQLPDGQPGFNYRRDLESAAYEIEHFPETVPMVYAGGARGGRQEVYTGPRVRAEAPAGHIVRRAYELWFAGRGDDPDDWRRGSWDQLRVLYGVRGLGHNFVSSGPGELTLTIVGPRDARFRWVPDPTGHFFWLELAPGERVEDDIQDLMIWPGAGR